MDQSRLIAQALGAIPGIVVAGVGIKQFGEGKEKSLGETKKDLVPAIETVKEHAPELYVATNKEDILKGDLTKFQKFLVKTIHAKSMGQIFEGNNAAYVPLKNTSMIISPKMVNKSVIGHEIGHHVDAQKKQFRLLDQFINSKKEQRAWELSPFQGEKDKTVSDIMLNTYKGGDKIFLGTVAATVGALAAPLVLKALKR